MKAVLVLPDMPENCHKCPVDCAAYMASDQVTFKARLEGCPLLPMPEEKEFFFWNDGYSNGWNAALREIGGCKDNGNTHIYYEDDRLSPDR